METDGGRGRGLSSLPGNRLLSTLRSRLGDVRVGDGALFLRRRDEGNGRVPLGEVPLLS